MRALIDGLPLELVALIFGWVREPALALVSREWCDLYARERACWQAFLCRFGFVSHYGGYRRRCTGCLAVTVDYLRLMRDIEADLMRPWVVRVVTGTKNVIPAAVSSHSHFGLRQKPPAVLPQLQKRRRVHDAEPPRQP